MFNISLLKLFAFFSVILSCSNQQIIGNNKSEENRMNTPLTTNIFDAQKAKGLEVATIGGGCFWCLEAIYQDIEGIEKVESGYAGGHLEAPTYADVCDKKTGHAEVTQITFDPKKISFKEIIDIFWHIHNPTTLNQQGNDVGPQYRSVIFYHNEAQKSIAEISKKESQESGLWKDPYVTEITAFTNFYKAENYHQNYFKDNPNQPYCIYVVNPKVQKFKKEFQQKVKK